MTTPKSPRPAAREALYRKFEHLLIDPAILVPLFHEVDYRIAGPRVRGLQLRSAAPYVNYAELGKAEAAADRCKYQTLRRELPDKPRAAGAQGEPDAELMRARRGARHQKSRDVGACGGKEQAYSRH